MEPISTALIAAIAAGAASGTSEVATKAVVDAYQGLKGLVIRKFGASSDVAEAVTKLEQQPERDDRQATVATELKLAKAGDDQELLTLAQQLLDQLKCQPGGDAVVHQVAHGTGIAQASGGSTATVTMGGDALPKKP